MYIYLVKSLPLSASFLATENKEYQSVPYQMGIGCTAILLIFIINYEVTTLSHPSLIKLMTGAACSHCQLPKTPMVLWKVHQHSYSDVHTDDESPSSMAVQPMPIW